MEAEMWMEVVLCTEQMKVSDFESEAEGVVHGEVVFACVVGLTGLQP